MTVENAAVAAPETSAPAPEASATPTSETAATETPPVTSTPEPKKDPESAKFAALARKEKANREAEQRVKQAEQQLQQRQAEVDARAKELEERLQKSKSGNPIERIKAIGVSPEEVNQALLGGWKEPEVDPVDAKLTPLQQKIEKVLKENEELRKKVEGVDNDVRQREQHQNYLKFVDAVKKTVEADPDKFEYVSLHGQEAIDLVQEVMVKHYQDNNNALLGYDEACELVEEWYEQKAETLLKSRKLQGKVQPPSQQTPQSTSPAKAKDEPATLTAAMSSASQDTVDITKMSDREAQAYIARLMTMKK